jgi:hypothetical protein
MNEGPLCAAWFAPIADQYGKVRTHSWVISKITVSQEANLALNVDNVHISHLAENLAFLLSQILGVQSPEPCATHERLRHVQSRIFLVCINRNLPYCGSKLLGDEALSYDFKIEVRSGQNQIGYAKIFKRVSTRRTTFYDKFTQGCGHDIRTAAMGYDMDPVDVGNVSK